MTKSLFLLFLLLSNISFLLGQGCEKAWMHYEERLALSQETKQKHNLDIPIEKIQLDFLGAPIGVPFNYSIQLYSEFSDHVLFTEGVDFLLHKEAYQSLVLMRQAAKKAGFNLDLNDCYRSYSEQAKLYKKLGPNVAEKPGYSEHHLYTAIDIKGVSSSKFLWMLRYAFDFGWIPSYYFRVDERIKAEPWHWRYVGKLAATKFRCAWEMEINRRIWKLKAKG